MHTVTCQMSYAWGVDGRGAPPRHLEDAMFNMVLEEIDGFDLGTNAGRASALEAALFPAPSSPTCWMSPLKSLPGEYREGAVNTCHSQAVHRGHFRLRHTHNTHTVVGARGCNG